MFRFASGAKNTKTAAFIVFLMTFLQGLVAYAWLAEPFKFTGMAWIGPPMAALMALYVALYAIPAGWTVHRTKSPVAFGLTIGLMEWLRSFMFTGFAWNPVSVGWSFYLPMMQSLSLFGAYGLSALTAMAAAFLSKKSKAKFGISILLGLLIFGLIRLEKPGYMPLKVRLMNIDQKNPLAPDPMKLSKFELFANAAGAEGIGLFALPESASDADLYLHPPSLASVVRMNNPRSVAILGMTRRSDGKLFNSMAVVEAGGILGHYDKRHLVPFGEYMPRWLPFLEKMTAGSIGFSAGSDEPVLEIRNRTAVPLICFEAIFPGLRLRGKSDLLLNISNDAWFAPQGRIQHFELSRMRAIEEGVPMVRAANSGISALISPQGHVGTILHAQGYADGLMFAPGPKTLFGFTGNWLFVIIAMGGLGWICSKRRRSL
jgi:apolipoprotein N-acyltransferase